MPAGQVTHIDKDTFNRLFPLPACIQPVTGGPPGPGMEIVPWPSLAASVRGCSQAETRAAESDPGSAAVPSQANVDPFFSVTSPADEEYWHCWSAGDGVHTQPLCTPSNFMGSAGGVPGAIVLNSNPNDAVPDIANDFGSTTMDMFIDEIMEKVLTDDKAS